MISDRITTSVMAVGISAIIVMAGILSGQSVMGQNRGGPGILSLHCNGMPVSPLNQNDTSAIKRLIGLFENSILDRSQVPQGPNVEVAELEVTRDSINDVGVVCVFMSLRCNGSDPGQLCRQEQISPINGSSNLNNTQ